MTKIDISSTAIEKGIDLVKDFIEKLIGSSIEEAGLFMSDNIKLRRFKNQIKILDKAQKIVAQSNINVKQLSLKALVPLLEYSSLEEDENLQEKWSNLLVNFVDSNERYESTIFPFILNQISTDELNLLELFYPVDKLKFNTHSRIMFNNLVRLGLIEKNVSSTLYIYSDSDKEPVPQFYRITELGKEFVRCCSPKENEK